jgi:type 1 fimbriae regulatory protein FimB/type 1 fimbriae regulatory protein FimE
MELEQGLLHVSRLKRGTTSVHPIRGPELRALRKLLKDSPTSPYLFVSERRAPIHIRSFLRIVARAGEEAGFEFPVHPHMLRHACGYKLANDGQDTRAIQHYMGHKNIQNTARYMELSPARFNDFWKD